MKLCVILLFLMCHVLEIKTGRVKRVVSTHEELEDSNLVSLSLDYGIDEEVENIEEEISGEDEENDLDSEDKQIQIIQKSNDKVTKVNIVLVNTIMNFATKLKNATCFHWQIKKYNNPILGRKCGNSHMQIKRPMVRLWMAATKWRMVR